MSRGTTAPKQPWLKPGVFVGALVPLLALLVHAGGGDLGANPIAEALNRLGLLALVFLLASLACTPLKTLVGWVWPIRLRRMLGLFAFFYALVHALTYAALDQGWSLSAMLADVTKRGFIALGFGALVLLAPLAATSTAFSVRGLGFVRWKRLHRLVYVAGVLAVLHFLWRVKLDLSEPLLYSFTLALLFVARLGGPSAGRASRQPNPQANASNIG